MGNVRLTYEFDLTCYTNPLKLKGVFTDTRPGLVRPLILADNSPFPYSFSLILPFPCF